MERLTITNLFRKDSNTLERKTIVSEQKNTTNLFVLTNLRLIPPKTNKLFVLTEWVKQRIYSLSWPLGIGVSVVCMVQTKTFLFPFLPNLYCLLKICHLNLLCYILNASPFDEEYRQMFFSPAPCFHNYLLQPRTSRMVIGVAGPGPSLDNCRGNCLPDLSKSSECDASNGLVLGSGHF